MPGKRRKTKQWRPAKTNAFDRLLADEKRPENWEPKKRCSRKKRRKVSEERRAKKRRDKWRSEQRGGYQDYIQTSEWKRFRELAMNHHGRRCSRCGSWHGPFEVHHKTYDRLFGELVNDVEVLCAECHGIEHEDKHSPRGPLFEEFKQIVQ
jgi:hypothetical protein